MDRQCDEVPSISGAPSPKRDLSKVAMVTNGFERLPWQFKNSIFTNCLQQRDWVQSGGSAQATFLARFWTSSFTRRADGRSVPNNDTTASRTARTVPATKSRWMTTVGLTERMREIGNTKRNVLNPERKGQPGWHWIRYVRKHIRCNIRCEGMDSIVLDMDRGHVGIFLIRYWTTLQFRTVTQAYISLCASSTNAFHFLRCHNLCHSIILMNIQPMLLRSINTLNFIYTDARNISNYVFNSKCYSSAYATPSSCHVFV